VRINVAVPESNVSAPVLDAALESVTRLNENMLQNGEVPTFRRALRSHGIQWRPEPPGAEHFDHAQTVLGRRWGDCDDLAPYHAASLRSTGEDPDATAIVVPSGPKMWHAVVQRGNGDIDDPSKEAGMGRPRGARGAALPMLSAHGGSSVVGAYRIRPQIALRPAYGIWQARADMPWHWREHEDHDDISANDFSMAALHASPVASTALVGAIEGAIDLANAAGYGDPEHVDRLLAIADAVEGCGYDELREKWGEEHARAATHVVGSFWSGLSKIVKKVAPFVSKAVSFIPGIGPVAATAIDVATMFIPDPKDPAKKIPVAPVALADAAGNAAKQAMAAVKAQIAPGAPSLAVPGLPGLPPGMPAPAGLAALQQGGRSGRICFPATFE
jgi:hypothetical protein